MSISTKAIGPVDMNTSPKTKTKDKDETATDAFSTLINAASGANRNNENNVKNTNSVLEVSKASEIERPDTESAVKPDKGNETRTENTDGKSKINEAGSEKVQQTEKKDSSDTQSEDGDADATGIEAFDVKEDFEVSEHLVSEIITEFTDMIKDLLDIDDSELNNLLADMGLNIQDLMIKSNLNDFILQFNDATSVDVLINENLNNLLKTASNLLDNFMKRFDISSVDAEAFVSEVNAVLADAEVPDTEDFAAEKALQQTDADINAEPDAENAVKTEVQNGTGKNAEIIGDDTVVAVKADESAAETSQYAGSGANAGTGRQSGHSADAGEHIINNLNQAINNIIDADAVEMPDMTQSISEADIVRQIIDEVKVNMSNDTTSLELQLNPQHLGKVQISVSTKNGVMQAQIITENEAARHAIEANMAALKETFDNQGLKVDAVEVMVATYEFFSNGQEQSKGENAQNARRTGAGNSGTLDDEPEEEDALLQELMQANGNTVSYMA